MRNHIRRRTKQRGGNNNIGKVIKIISLGDGQDITQGIYTELNADQRVSGRTLRFETDDNKGLTIQFYETIENEGQFNKGVGTVEEHPEWFARIHKVESNDKEQIESGLLLYTMCPYYFIQYHGIYHIIGNFYLQLMDKVDFTLFKYIIYYLEKSPNRMDLPAIVNELCPMIYSLIFQSIILKEMKYRRFQERYIDFKADNIGIIPVVNDPSQPTTVMFEGLGIRLPLQFNLLGQPTTIYMKLIDQQIIANPNMIYHNTFNAFIYDLVKTYIWAPYGRNIYSKQFNIREFRTDTKKIDAVESYRSLINAAECSHEKAYEAIVETLLLDEGRERYKDIYRVVMNLLAESLMFSFPDKEKLETALPEGLSLYNASLIYNNYNENIDIFSEEFYKKIITNKDTEADEDLRNYIRLFNVSTLKIHYHNVLKNIDIGESFIRDFHTNYNDSLRLKLQHCVYMNDNDFDVFISMLRDSVKIIEAFFKSDNSLALKKRNVTYEWIIPEFSRIYTEQWISIYSTWRRLVREFFILGEPKGDGKINLLEAKNEAWQFDAVFKDLVRVAGFSYNTGEERTMGVKMVPFVPPEKEVSITLEEFKKIFIR